tara:strand:+ start:4264 stop:4416 length:153 start_codon:yes stop_codon:yes gene_type:complete
MEYQPFLNMNVLVSDALLATLPAFFQIVLVCVGAFVTFKLLSRWLDRDDV